MSEELIHTDFETIERDKEWRISTRVEYRTGREQYKCKATLFRSRNGRVQWPESDRKHRRSEITSNKEEIDTLLEDCIESCKDKLDKIEDARNVSVNVDITDES
jgi:hypothetical protein